MFTKSLQLLSISAVAGTAISLFSASSASAITVNFSGELSFGGLGFNSGDAVTGSIRFDRNAFDVSPNPNFGQYNGAIQDFSLSIAGNNIVNLALDANSSIINDVDRPNQDRVTFGGIDLAFDSGVSDCNDVSSCNLSLVFIDFSETILSNNSPVDRIPRINQLQSFDLAFGSLVAPVGGSDSSIQFSIDEFERQAVPEPLTILGTLFAGGIGLGLRKKKSNLHF